MKQHRATEGTSEPTPGRTDASGIRWGWVVAALLVSAVFAVALYHWWFPEPRRRLAGAMVQWVGFLESGRGTNGLRLSGRLRVTDAAGRWQPWRGAVLAFHLQPPDHARLEWQRPEGTCIWIRRGRTLEVHAPQKRFGLRGRPDLSFDYETDPETEIHALPEIRSPVPPGKVWMAALTLQVRPLPDAIPSDQRIWAVAVRPQPRVVSAGTLPEGEVRFWLREEDGLPVRVEFWNRAGTRVLTLECDQWHLDRAPTAELWQPEWPEGHRIEEVPLALLSRYWTRWWQPAPSTLQTSSGAAARPGGPAAIDGSQSGAPRLVPVLQVSGTAAERARQLAQQQVWGVHETVSALAYGWAVEKSLEQGHWLGPRPLPGRKGSATAPTAAMHQIAIAMAESSGLQPEEVIWTHQLAARLSGSVWAVEAAAPSSHQTILLGYAAWEEARFAEGSPPMLVVHKPDRGSPWAGITRAGLFGCVAGLNRRQLAVVALDQPEPDEIPDPPAFVRAAEVLETTDSLETATDLLRQVAWTHRATWLLAEGLTGRAVRVQVGPGEFAVEPFASPGAPHQTWAFLAGPPPVGAKRWSPKAASLPNSSSFAVTAIEEILAALPRPARAWTVCLDPSEGTCWVQPADLLQERPGFRPPSWNLLAWLVENERP
ncbi:MAG: hypothetical protein N2438_00675 [Limisphaera sp.]|nr:hypothetical protein [Limisphaera sp.]